MTVDNSRTAQSTESGSERFDVTGWQLLYVLVSLAAGFMVFFAYFEGWSVRDIVFFAFICLFFDPSDGIILRKVSR